jgi:hypothetical protein
MSVPPSYGTGILACEV